MDSFERIVAMLLERQGYWTRISYRIELTAEDKAAIRRPSCPRWEIDVIALRPKTNELLVIECKSFLDSKGVQFKDLSEDDDPESKGRYKILTEPTLRKVLLHRLVAQLEESGLAASGLSVRLAMAVGKFKNEMNRTQTKEMFDANGWQLFDEAWLREHLRRASEESYENDIAFVVSKLLLRK